MTPLARTLQTALLLVALAVVCYLLARECALTWRKR